MPIIIEQSCKIKAELPERDVHKGMEVFYNPVMASNRNISLLLLNGVENKNMNLADPLAGSGIRSLRFLKELKKSKIKQLYVNDIKANFSDSFAEILKLNNIHSNKISIHNQDANLFMLNQEGFDYIDIDPFGSPNNFLAAAISRISRKGIIAVTATDTAALTGTYPKVTQRKYWASNVKNYLMHETGLRILIRKVQLIGMQFDKALIPILAYSKDHYFRIYFKNDRRKESCDEIIKQHLFFLYNSDTLEFKSSKFNLEQGFTFVGPLWIGKLFDAELIKKMAGNNNYPEEQKFLDLLNEEAKIDVLGFYDLHALAKAYKSTPPKMEWALQKLNGVRTHFSLNGIKTDKRFNEVIKIIVPI